VKRYTFLADKLVRNKALDQMTAQGIECTSGVVLPEKKEFYLKKKIAEEAQELLESQDRDHILSELCDVFEAAYALMDLYGLQESDLLKKSAQKREAKGSYDQFFHLKTLTLPENHSKISHYFQEKKRYPEIPI
jgi:predicted house-cleaning noncanonical NTP pyrophosphatase (MazG superfamily)